MRVLLGPVGLQVGRGGATVPERLLRFCESAWEVVVLEGLFGRIETVRGYSKKRLLYIP